MSLKQRAERFLLSSSRLDSAVIGHVSSPDLARPPKRQRLSKLSQRRPQAGVIYGRLTCTAPDPGDSWDAEDSGFLELPVQSPVSAEVAPPGLLCPLLSPGPVLQGYITHFFPGAHGGSEYTGALRW